MEKTTVYEPLGLSAGKSEAMHEVLIVACFGVSDAAAGSGADDYLAGAPPEETGVAPSRAAAHFEMGLPPAPIPIGCRAAGTVTAIGAGVPIASVLTASITAISVSDLHPEASSAIRAGDLFMEMSIIDQQRPTDRRPGPGSLAEGSADLKEARAGAGADGPIRGDQAGVRAGRLRRGLSPRLIERAFSQSATLPPLPRSPEGLERDVEPGRDDRQGVEYRDRRRGHDRRQQSFADVAVGQHQPSQGEEGQPEVRQAVGQHPRLGIRLVEEHEVAQPAQAEPGISTRVGRQLGDGPAEEDPRSLGFRKREPSRLLVGPGQGDVVDVARLVTGFP